MGLVNNNNNAELKLVEKKKRAATSLPVRLTSVRAIHSSFVPAFVLL